MMKKYLFLPVIVLFIVGIAIGQSDINIDEDKFDKKVRELKSEKNIFWEQPEPGWTSSKIIAVSKKFRESEVLRVSVEEIDFAVAVLFEGHILENAPSEFILTFRLKNKKPVFAASNVWAVILGSEILDFGNGRYAIRAGEKKEYLNFRVSRENLEKISKAPNVRFKLGEAELKVSSEQQRILANFLIATNPAFY